MSAAAHGRAPLELVPTPDDTTVDPIGAPVDVETRKSWEAQTVLNPWEPEHQLIGALMWMSADQARPILELVPDTAIWRPTIRWAYQIIRGLVDNGRDPSPVEVLHTAKHQPCSESAKPNEPPSPGRHHKFAVYLANAYTHTISPAAAESYARLVLDEAYRRAFRENGIRMHQLGECDTEHGDLTEQFIAIRNDLADWRRRAEAAAKPGWSRP
jgi:replicative DNA helicase